MVKKTSQREKISANHTYEKRLVSKILKKIIPTKNGSIRKWEKDMKGHSTEEDVQTANKHMKRHSASLAIREIQIKITMKYH